jgi:hypothetical protein
LGDGSTNNLPVGSDCNCGSSEYVAYQRAVSSHGQRGTQYEVNVVRPGASFKHNVASGASGKCGANIENKLGVWVSFSIKIHRGISQGYVDGRTMDMDSGEEPLAPHFGKHVSTSRHGLSLIPSSQSIGSAVLSTRVRQDIAAGQSISLLEDEISRVGCAWTDSEESANNVTISCPSAGGSRASKNSKILACAEVHRFTCVTELAATLFPSTKQGT